ncbi:MAG: glycosyltransferase 87 family protein [Cyclobacteriaceae bacterium]
MQRDKEKSLLTGLLVALSLIAYIYIGYFARRHDTIPLILAYTSAFGAYYALYILAKNASSYTWFNALSLMARLSLIVAVPSLSDDVYRFIWDGELLASGLDSFAYTPEEYATRGLLNENEKLSKLYSLLNSPGYFTIYPPFCQLIFYLSAVLSPKSILGSIIVIRLFILLAEGITLMLLPRMLRSYNIPPQTSLLYSLNPLVILELTGNLHFEAWAITGLLACIYFWRKNNILTAGFAMALAVLSKLLPLITIPLFFRKKDLVRSGIFFVTAGLMVLIALIPYLDTNLLNGMKESSSLYFSRFEFNASVYYLVRTVGYWYKGYNIIATAGVVLAAIAGLLIIAFTLYYYRHKMKIPTAMMWVYVMYYCFTTTLHPWYTLMLLPLCLFSKWRFPVVWTAMVFLTYVGYTSAGYSENLWITAVEYLVVTGWMMYEATTGKIDGYLIQRTIRKVLRS